jgi:hypothetical protein
MCNVFEIVATKRYEMCTACVFITTLSFVTAIEKGMGCEYVAVLKCC